MRNWRKVSPSQGPGMKGGRNLEHRQGNLYSVSLLYMVALLALPQNDARKTGAHQHSGRDAVLLHGELNISILGIFSVIILLSCMSIITH